MNRSKQKALDMVNKGTGIPAPPRNRQERPKPVRPPESHGAFSVAETNAMQMVLIKGLGEQGKAITTNLLSKSGLTGNRVVRDLNILENSACCVSPRAGGNPRSAPASKRPRTT